MKYNFFEKSEIIDANLRTFKQKTKKIQENVPCAFWCIGSDGAHQSNEWGFK